MGMAVDGPVASSQEWEEASRGPKVWPPERPCQGGVFFKKKYENDGID